MQDGVEGVGGVAGVEVVAGGGAVAVEDDGLFAVEEEGEFGYDFWSSKLVSWLLVLNTPPCLGGFLSKVSTYSRGIDEVRIRCYFSRL